jgi:hypothetical protein
MSIYGIVRECLPVSHSLDFKQRKCLTGIAFPLFEVIAAPRSGAGLN